MSPNSKTNYRWYVLTMVTLVNMLAYAVAWVSISVLFKEISQDLNLSILQLGTIWGMVPLATLIFVLPGGLLGDRFGVRRVVGIACLATGIFGALRGISGDFITLATFTFLFGAVHAPLLSNLPKVLRAWFPDRLGLANGISSAGFSVGMALGVMFSASQLSPLLGGWQSVMFFYGAIAILFGFLWLVTVREQAPSEPSSGEGIARIPFREAFTKIIHIRDVWLCSIAFLGVFGANTSVIGYLPFYLEGTGIPKVTADSIASASMWGFVFGNLVMPAVSDRIGLRRVIYILCASIAIICVLLIPFLSNTLLWLIVIGFGFFGAGAFTHHFIVATEVKGVGSIYAGTAVGLASTLGSIGGFIAPIIGGALAEIDIARPFLFWPTLYIISIICFIIIKETGHRAKKND